MGNEKEESKRRKRQANPEITWRRPSSLSQSSGGGDLFIYKAMTVYALVMAGAMYYYDHREPDYMKTFPEAKAYCAKRGDVLPTRNDVESMILYHLFDNRFRNGGFWLDDGSYMPVQDIDKHYSADTSLGSKSPEIEDFNITYPKDPEEKHAAFCLRKHAYRASP